MSENNIPFISKFESAFSSMLIHSIWEGALLVLILLLVVNFTQFNLYKRHQLSKWTLSIFSALTLFTFFIILLDIPFDIKIGEISPIFNSFELNNSICTIINSTWAIGSCFFIVRYIFGVQKIKKIIHQSSGEFPSHWIKIYSGLKNNMSKSRNIILIHSKVIGSAFMNGIFKPVIVVPTSWVNSLSIEETQFILTHELIHILRKDHWTNLMICYIEIIFFFNPAINFIISRIRFERELCADADTLELINRPLQYASLLVKLEESALNVQTYSVGFLNEKMHLTQRVNKILGKNTETFFPWRLIFFFSVLTYLFCLKHDTTISTDTCIVSDPSISELSANTYNNINIELFLKKEEFRKISKPLKFQKGKVKNRKKNDFQFMLQNSEGIDLSLNNRTHKTNLELDVNNSEDPELIVGASILIDIEEGLLTFHANDENRDVINSILKVPPSDKYYTIKNIINNKGLINPEINELIDEPGTILNQNIETNIN